MEKNRYDWLVVCLCMLPGTLWGQKAIRPTVQSLVKQPVVYKHFMQTPPFIKQSSKGILMPYLQRQVAARGLVEPVLTQYTRQQQSKLANWDKWNFVHKQIKRYWPVFERNSEQGEYIRTINAWMEMPNPNEYVRKLQEEFIYERWALSRFSPEDLVKQVNHWFEQGKVPPRAWPTALERYTDEEITLGEDLVFAVAAFKVELEENALRYHPWRVPGMEEIVDRVTTYWAMRRSTSEKEGLPETGIDGTHNFPIWTKQEFIINRQSWVSRHPFEYALAKYQERILGDKLGDIFNSLPVNQKWALLFTAPKLREEQSVEILTQEYDNALSAWIQQNRRDPHPLVYGEDRIQFSAFLLNSPKLKPALRLFEPYKGLRKEPFQTMPSAKQLEVLMWAWKAFRLPPDRVLADLAR